MFYGARRFKAYAIYTYKYEYLDITGGTTVSYDLLGCTLFLDEAQGMSSRDHNAVVFREVVKFICLSFTSVVLVLAKGSSFSRGY